MPKQELSITSILGGISPTAYFGADDSYIGALGIDPDFPTTASAVRASGLIMPTRYETFSSTSVATAPKWIVTNPKDTKVYVYLDNGAALTYTSALASETALTTPTSGAGNGCHYYNNYNYYATPTDVARYGPLDGAAAMTQTVWTGSTLGTQPSLINSTYPTLQGVAIPNHSMHVHTDNVLYFCDYNTTANPGKGSIHKIKTKKVTAEGDTNDGSDNDVLALPFGFRPVDLESFNTDLAILAIQTSDTTINQGKAALFLWDTTSISFYAQIAIPDPIATALLNVNGVLHIWSGNSSNGVRLSRYTGGYGVNTVVYQEEGTPPYSGAVDAFGDRISWGGWTSYPESAGVVWSYGSKDSRLPQNVSCNVRTKSGTSTPNVTAIKYALQANNIQPRLITGWRNQ